MIPKVIHYCWFGGNPLPKSAIKCIESWKKYLPDYEIKEWNESNFDINMMPYTREAYEMKKYAYVSDVARFLVLYREGGVYFDTDVEVVKPMYDILEAGAFMGIEDLGIEGETYPYVAPGLGLAVEAGNSFYKEILDHYFNCHYYDPLTKIPYPLTVVNHCTNLLIKNGLKPTNKFQTVAGINIYPVDYFCPLEDATGILTITDNTRAIHWFSKTWIDKPMWYFTITRFLHRIFGIDSLVKVRKLLNLDSAPNSSNVAANIQKVQSEIESCEQGDEFEGEKLNKEDSHNIATIPPKIHYCWFGGAELPESMQRCISSWRRFFPEYEIKEWNETNFDVNILPYTQEAYKAKKYAFVSDVARFWILYHEGGIYFDTDVEIVSTFDDIISKGAFMGIESHCKPGQLPDVNPGLGLGAEKGNPILKSIFDYYKTLRYSNDAGDKNPGTVVTHTTHVLAEQYGLQSSNDIQVLNGITIYPMDYFCPFDDLTGVLKPTANTRSIHWFAKTWTDQPMWYFKMTRVLHRFFGVRFFNTLKSLLGISDR